MTVPTLAQFNESIGEIAKFSAVESTVPTAELERKAVQDVSSCKSMEELRFGLLEALSKLECILDHKFSLIENLEAWKWFNNQSAAAIVLRKLRKKSRKEG